MEDPTRIKYDVANETDARLNMTVDLEGSENIACVEGRALSIGGWNVKETVGDQTTTPSLYRCLACVSICSLMSSALPLLLGLPMGSCAARFTSRRRASATQARPLSLIPVKGGAWRRSSTGQPRGLCLHQSTLQSGLRDAVPTRRVACIDTSQHPLPLSHPQCQDARGSGPQLTRRP